MITEEEFLDIIKNNNEESIFKLGKISSTYTTGRPSVLFDGETTPSIKTYPYIGSYIPQANERVLLARIASSFIILGKIV